MQQYPSKSQHGLGVDISYTTGVQGRYFPSRGNAIDTRLVAHAFHMLGISAVWLDQPLAADPINKS